MTHTSCGVGLLVSLKNIPDHEILKKGLIGLKNVEHRGGANSDSSYGDGAGIMTTIPYELLDIEPGLYAVATIFAPNEKEKRRKSLVVFEETFAHYGLHIHRYREVPTDPSVIHPKARQTMPHILHAIIKRPEHCRTLHSFDELLYRAKQSVRVKERESSLSKQFFLTSLSSRTIIYKSLSTSEQLACFYPDLQNPKYKTTFALFHRRFSTNTLPSWEKIQPFRLIAHNGEINTLEGNRAQAITREKAIGLDVDQIVTHSGHSDSGNLNEMVEALKYKSSIPHMNEILAIMIPPARQQKIPYFQFWSRAMEPWDGPAFVAFCDGKRIGARLDRSGFRPCRWHKTEDHFYLCSEAGAFEVDPSELIQQGTLYAGRSVTINMLNGEIDFNNPNAHKGYADATFDPRLEVLEYCPPKNVMPLPNNRPLFYYTKEDYDKELHPMIEDGVESIGSMGDTARLPALSDIHRSIYDYFFQNFAQVTNPPLDYIRESMVIDLSVYLGRKPNIFSPKELIPPPRAFMLKGPVMSLGQMETIYELSQNHSKKNIKPHVEDITFKRSDSVQDFHLAIAEKVNSVVAAVRNGATIIVLSDRKSTFENPPIPSILVMRAVQLELNRLGLRLRVSIIIDSGEIRNSHQIATLISFGASAICPYLALDMARNENLPKVNHLFPDEREKRLINAFTKGLMRIMAKMGISVIRSYQSSELFTILGIDQDIINQFFPGHDVFIGGLNFKNLIKEILDRTEKTQNNEIPNNFIYKEHAGEKFGESHSITSKKARALHQILKGEYNHESYRQWADSLHLIPHSIRNLFCYISNPIDLKKVEPIEQIMKTFGAGAMSFGSISAEAQRDIFLAFKSFGGRSNSGEGGENPYYFTEGITGHIKQIASGRFGVTAEYLVIGHEVQIKIAQGAKPGEGGQLMGPKVSPEIAKARFSTPGVDLISPPPQHDIYSIEDLKQLIYEIKQLDPRLAVSVKLVAGKNIGAIALGVVKSGADIIQISGGNGGTGAAALMSMKHCGLPWEIGLLEVHRTLLENGYRDHVRLRVDGGLANGLDIIMASLLGADEFDFGKNVLISQGCIMARICEKNTCPAGIATQDPKFKERYKGKPEDIVNYLKHIAEDVRGHLAQIGVESLRLLRGKSSLLKYNDNYKELIEKTNINLKYFMFERPESAAEGKYIISMNSLNKKILDTFLAGHSNIKMDLPIHSTDRAIPASLAGEMARDVADLRKQKNYSERDILPSKHVELNFTGSAGQGFGVFTTANMKITLSGEANDSVAKGMSGGLIVVKAHPDFKKATSENVLVGNACLYGATGGEFYLDGMAGDRFAVRNSGAVAMAEGAGLHSCEYMTGGTVVLLQGAQENIGAGMTGGVLYLNLKCKNNINTQYLKHVPLRPDDLSFLTDLLQKHFDQTQSSTAKRLLENPSELVQSIGKFLPL